MVASPRRVGVSLSTLCAWFSLSVAVGCGGDGASETPVAAGEDPGARTESAGGDYEVHEWGLVSARVGSPGFDAISHGGLVANVFARGGGGGGVGHILSQPMHSAGIGKPVLYVHLAPGVDSLRFEARVTVPEGHIVEHWPPGRTDAHGSADSPTTASAVSSTISWTVSATRAPCRGTYPGPGSDACRTPDGYCELAEVSAYETDEAACVRVGEQQAGVLFYRAEGPAALPLQVSQLADGAYRVALDAAAEAPGRVWRVHRSARDHADTRVALLDAPTPGHPLRLPPWDAEGALPSSAAEADAALLVSLSELGLSDAERDAFMRAWRADLLGPAPTRGVTPDSARATAPDPRRADDPPADSEPSRVGAGAAGSAPEGGYLAALDFGTPVPECLAPATDALLYFLPPSTAQGLLPLSFDPAPQALHRAILVRVNLTPAPPGSGGGTPTPPFGAPASTPGGAPSHRLRLDPSRTSAEGELAPAVVHRILRRHLSELGACPGVDQAVGALRVRMEVRAGHVRTAVARAERGARYSRATQTCVQQRARSWVFPVTSAPEEVEWVVVAVPPT